MAEELTINKKMEERIQLLEYSKSLEADMVVSYQGPVDNAVLYTIGNYLRDTLGSESLHLKKLFSVFMELAQNISLYSAERFRVSADQCTGVGVLRLFNKDGYFRLLTGNMVKKEEVDMLLERAHTINSMDRPQLRKMKREHRRKPIGIKGGGNIGMIKVALAAEGPICTQIEHVNEEMVFLSLSVDIKKE